MMKRENTSTKHNINSHFSLFSWKECFFCKQEFRRENGWYWVSQGRFIEYSCSDCCKTAKECDEKIDSWLRNIRPSAPSSPPKKPKPPDILIERSGKIIGSVPLGHLSEGITR